MNLFKICVVCALVAFIACSDALAVGDCDRNGTVTISELQNSINMFLGVTRPDTCVDEDFSGSVSASEVQSTFNSFLGLLPAASLIPGFDPTGQVRFGFGRGVDGAAAVAVQSDGKIVLAGASFPAITEHNIGAVVRLKQDGTLDSSFGDHGKAHVQLDVVSAMAVDAAGRIVVVGAAQSLTGFDPDFAVVRLNADGSPDATFGSGGKSVIAIGPGFYDVASSLALQSDGKIVLAGQGKVEAVGGFVAARLKTDGSLDEGFGAAGMVAVAIDGGAAGVAIDLSGRIVMAGGAMTGGSESFAFVRLNSDGTPDNGFGAGGDGIVTVAVGSGSSWANAVAIDNAGRIIAAGTDNSDFAAVRLDAAGFPDVSFGDKGVSIVPGFGHCEFSGLVAQVNGKISLIGNENLNGTTPVVEILVQLNSDGTPDPGFGDGYGVGKSLIQPCTYDRNRGSAVALDSLGRAVVAGSDAVDFAAWRLTVGGTADNGFGTGGEARVDVGDEQGQARALTRLADGKFLVAGFTSTLPGSFAVAKMNPNGRLDDSFGTYGKVRIPAGQAYGMTVTSGGKIVLVGQSPVGGKNVFSAVRLSADGSPDIGFGDAGQVFLHVGNNDHGYAVAEDATGGIIIAGSTLGSGISGFLGTAVAVVRLGPDGALDTGFGSGGKALIPLQGDFFGSSSMTIDAAGKIVVVGAINGSFAVARLNANGTPDTSFVGSGLLTITVGSGRANAKAVGIDAQGNLLIGGVTGSSSAPLAVVRLQPSGAMDATFGSNGIARLTFGGSWYQNSLQTLQVDAVCRVVIAGGAYPVAGNNADFAVARLLSNGALDTTFGTGGVITRPVGENDDVAYAMVMQGNGDIVLAGNGSYQFGVVRIAGVP